MITPTPKRFHPPNHPGPQPDRCAHKRTSPSLIRSHQHMLAVPTPHVDRQLQPYTHPTACLCMVQACIPTPTSLVVTGAVSSSTVPHLEMPASQLSVCSQPAGKQELPHTLGKGWSSHQAAQQVRCRLGKGLARDQSSHPMPTQPLFNCLALHTVSPPQHHILLESLTWIFPPGKHLATTPAFAVSQLTAF